MSEIDKFEHEAYQDIESIKEYLLSIIKGIEKRKVSLTSEDSQMVLYLNNFLMFKIRAKKKDKKTKLDISISWKETGIKVDSTKRMLIES
ncbi:MAG: amphi-Trp domain-containing protein [Desulfobacterales bacterium]|nr:amphi-Trp domain-containing protein [Desulfobacterales bacterium]